MANTFKNTIYRSPSAFGNIAIGLHGLLVVTSVLSIAISLFMVFSPDSSIELNNGDSLETAWLMLGLIWIPEMALSILCAVVFLIWLYRAFNNLPVLGARNLEYSPGWAIGCWFIPLVNFFKPYQVMRELYAESDPSKRIESLSGQTPASIELIGFWWGTFLAFGFALRLADRLSDIDGTPSHYFPVAYMTGHILMAISAVLAIVIVRNVDSWQNDVFGKLGLSERFAPPPPPVFGGNG